MSTKFGWGMTAVAMGALLTGLAGCKPGDAVKQSGAGSTATTAVQPAAAPQSSAPIDPATVGTVSGTIHFAGKAPERVKIDMSQDPVC